MPRRLATSRVCSGGLLHLMPRPARTTSPAPSAAITSLRRVPRSWLRWPPALECAYRARLGDHDALTAARLQAAELDNSTLLSMLDDRAAVTSR
jgi:hypothetical protein